MKICADKLEMFPSEIKKTQILWFNSLYNLILIIRFTKMANERDFSFKCLKIALIVIHSFFIAILTIVLILCIYFLAFSDKKGKYLSGISDFFPKRYSLGN